MIWWGWFVAGIVSGLLFTLAVIVIMSYVVMKNPKLMATFAARMMRGIMIGGKSNDSSHQPHV
jgi:hypothetical protein